VSQAQLERQVTLVFQVSQDHREFPEHLGQEDNQECLASQDCR
jgi:hypothetical protein